MKRGKLFRSDKWYHPLYRRSRLARRIVWVLSGLRGAWRCMLTQTVKKDPDVQHRKS